MDEWTDDRDGANWYGLWTLYVREVRRFLKVFAQTIVGPVATTLLFLAIFVLALGGAVKTVGQVPFVEFLTPGLIMMAVAQNAFANTSSSIFVSRIQGNIVDTLMPPLNADELTLGFAFGGVTRGVLVAVAVAAAMSLFVPLRFHDAAFIAYHLVAGALMLSLLGIVAGIWAVKFDHVAAVTNFVVTPLAFLSGTFYSIDRLPDGFALVAHLNPFFYMIDGFRYGFIGHADGVLGAGLWVLGGTNVALWLLCRWMFASGYRLKA